MLHDLFGTHKRIGVLCYIICICLLFFVIIEGNGTFYVGGIKMMYLLAIVLPPVAVLFSGKPLQALLNLILTLFFWFPGALHAILVVKDSKDEKRMKQYIQATRK